LFKYSGFGLFFSRCSPIWQQHAAAIAVGFVSFPPSFFFRFGAVFGKRVFFVPVFVHKFGPTSAGSIGAIQIKHNGDIA
jgi:hypothetical protein